MAKKKEIPPFYVVNWDFNKDELEFYNVMPYFVNCWAEQKKQRHKVWAINENAHIDSEDMSIGLKLGLSAHESIERNLSKKKKLDDTKMPQTFEEFKTFIDGEAFHQFWSRCEYEVIVTGWPQQKREHKMDVYEQIKTNLDTITKVFIDYITKGKGLNENK